MNWAVIPFEEARLGETFGQDYVDYCRRVRRWI
jgi:protein-S-isoprenylcysteine O-methyltransferase Ste14